MWFSLRNIMIVASLAVMGSAYAGNLDNDLFKSGTSSPLMTQSISNSTVAPFPAANTTQQQNVRQSQFQTQNPSPNQNSTQNQNQQLNQRGSDRLSDNQQNNRLSNLDLNSTNPEELSEFQKHVYSATQQLLPIFGRDLFEKAPTTFAPVDRIPVSSDYIVGPGDELMLQGWGQLDINYRAEVDRNGQLFIPKVGNVNVAGVPYADLKGLLKTVIGRYYKNFDLNVTLGQLRSIPVFVVGYAKKPGSYTVSSLSTLVNTLFVTGGASSSGSMRAIQVRRAGKTVVEFDLYDLLLRGDKSKDISLAPGDVIYIPPVSRQVAIIGGVNQPAIYEAKEGETLETLLATAGGLTATASGQKVRVERVDEHKSLKVEEFLLDKSGLGHGIKSGDIVTVYTISPRFDNAVTLRGFVAYPGRYPFKPGMTVRDLIPDLQSLVTPSYWEQRNLIDSKDVKDTEQEKESDVGLDEKALQAKTQKKLRETIDKNRSDINWDYAVIERINPKDLSTQLIPFNLGAALIKGDPHENLGLQAGDMVTIFSQSDLQVPQSRRTKFVRVEGEFNQAGIYQLEPGETLKQLLHRIGGVTPQAYWYGAMFTRESVRQLQQEKLDEFIARFESDLQKQSADAQASTLNKVEEQAKRQLIANMRSVKALGRIVLELKPTANSIDDLPDITLEDGDRLIVPQRSAVINVLGSVHNQNSYIYRANKTVGDYLAQAGGPKVEGSAKNIYVMRADGSVMSNQQTGWFSSIESATLMPSETVIVPVELDKSNLMQSLKDWTSILYQFGLGAAALATIKGL